MLFHSSDEEHGEDDNPADLGDLSRQARAGARRLQRPARQKDGRGEERPPHPRVRCRPCKALLDAGAAVVAVSHLGRPEKADAAGKALLTMDKVAARFGELLGRPVTKAGDAVVGPAVETAVKSDEAGRRGRARKRPVRPARAAERRGVRRTTRGAGGRLRQRRIRDVPQRPGCVSMVAVPAAMKAAGKPRAVGLLVAKELEVIDRLMTAPDRPVLRGHGRGQGVVTRSRSSTRCSGQGRPPA